MSETTITRRNALRTGGLAAIAASLLGTATTAASAEPAAVPSAPLVVGSTTNISDLVAEVRAQIEVVREHDRAAHEAQDAIYRTLTDEQKALFRAYEEADNDRDFEQMDLYLLDLGRHLPGLAPAIWALSRHMFESRLGECCLPDVEGSAS